MKVHAVTTLVLMIWLSSLSVAPAADLSGAPVQGAGVANEHSVMASPLFPASLFARTELYFGSLKPDGSMVSEEEFMGFLDAKITPRFPNGLTLLTGLGQFLNSQGVIQQEDSRLLILLYPVEERRDNSEKIEAIREDYKKAFEQESVLRADGCCELVGF